jgi:hypothetical protein
MLSAVTFQPDALITPRKEIGEYLLGPEKEVLRYGVIGCSGDQHHTADIQSTDCLSMEAR